MTFVIDDFSDTQFKALEGKIPKDVLNYEIKGMFPKKYYWYVFNDPSISEEDKERLKREVVEKRISETEVIWHSKNRDSDGKIKGASYCYVRNYGHILRIGYYQRDGEKEYIIPHSYDDVFPKIVEIVYTSNSNDSEYTKTYVAWNDSFMEICNEGLDKVVHLRDLIFFRKYIEKAYVENLRFPSAEKVSSIGDIFVLYKYSKPWCPIIWITNVHAYTTMGRFVSPITGKKVIGAIRPRIRLGECFVIYPSDIYRRRDYTKGNRLEFYPHTEPEMKLDRFEYYSIFSETEYGDYECVTECGNGGTIDQKIRDDGLITWHCDVCDTDQTTIVPYTALPMSEYDHEDENIVEESKKKRKRRKSKKKKVETSSDSDSDSD